LENLKGVYFKEAQPHTRTAREKRKTTEHVPCSKCDCLFDENAALFKRKPNKVKQVYDSNGNQNLRVKK
jgi:hypothetical protein